MEERKLFAENNRVVTMRRYVARRLLACKSLSTSFRIGYEIAVRKISLDRHYLLGPLPSLEKLTAAPILLAVHASQHSKSTCFLKRAYSHEQIAFFFPQFIYKAEKRRLPACNFLDTLDRRRLLAWPGNRRAVR